MAQLSSMKPSSMKLKTLFQTFIFSHVARALSKAKSLLLEHVRDMQFLHLAEFKKGKSCKKKLYFGSFRLHYNWCASHVMPLGQANSHIYYDGSWNAVVPAVSVPDKAASLREYEEEDGLSKYLEWLEEKGKIQESGGCNEIDKMAVES